jgi:predicted amidohydrolase YtcJ
VSWEGPGFVDHHAHVLRVAAGRMRDYCEDGVANPAKVAAWHRHLAEHDSTPMDEPVKPLEVHDGLRGALERSLVHARTLGIVQLTEAGMDDWAYLEALLGLRARGPLPVRVRLLVASGIADVDRMTRTGDPWLEIEGVKFYADGWLGTRTCALCSPYTDRPDEPGVLFLTAEKLAKRCDPFADAGWTIATHAIGDEAISTVLDAYEMVFGSDCRSAAPRIEHAQVLDEDLITRMADLGVVACVQPGFAVSDVASAREALGRDRFELAYRWDVLLDAGVRLIAGSDHPIESLSPLVGLQRLTTGDFEDGRKAGAATLDLARAWDLVTDAACGTVVLSEDPFKAGEDELARLTVEDTLPIG